MVILNYVRSYYVQEMHLQEIMAQINVSSRQMDILSCVFSYWRSTLLNQKIHFAISVVLRSP